MGSVSPAVQRRARALFACYVLSGEGGFAARVGARIRVEAVRASVAQRRAAAVCEIEVAQDMLDAAHGALHAGCAVYLLDMCTALPYIALGLAQEEARGGAAFAMAPFAPSQRLDVTFHHRARLGARLRVTSESVADDGPLLTVWGEIWDVGRDRPVASAVHAKVMPARPPAAAKGKL